MIASPIFLAGDLDSPLGTLRVVTDEHDRLVALEFDGHEERMRRLLTLHHGAVVLRSRRPPRAIADALAAFFAGRYGAVDKLHTNPGGTDFQRRVWSALRGIAPGKTESYGVLATRIGCPGGSRAVGRANGQNPIAIVVPCHRVLGADGTLTGYGGGVERKAWLLAHERAPFEPQRAVARPARRAASRAR